MATPKKITKQKNTSQTKHEQARSKMTFVFYNAFDPEKTRLAVKEDIKETRANYFFLNNADSFQLFDSELKVKTPEEVDVLLADSVIFVNSSQDNLSSELATWQSLDKNTAPNRPVHLYAKTGRLKGIRSESIGLPKAIASDLLKEGAQYPSATGLIDHRLNTLSYSAGLISSNPTSGLVSLQGNVTVRLKKWWFSYFTQPWALTKQIRGGGFLISEHPLFKTIFACLLVFGLIYLVLGSQHIGINSDEYRYIAQAQKVTNFYTSLGKDTSSCIPTGIDAMHYNIQIVDNFLYAVGKLFGWEYNFAFRHFMVSLICWLSILFAGLIALRLDGYKLGVITTIILICSPIFIGNGFNNERDFISVLGLDLAIFGLLSSGFVFPVLRAPHVAAIFMGLFMIGGQRVAGGLLCLAFLGVLAIAILYVNKKLNSSLWKDTAIRPWLAGIALTCIVSYIFTILIWPFGLLNPVKHILEALKFSNKVTVGMNQVFEGKLQLSTNMPPHYLIKYLSITVPAAVWLGFLFTIILVRRLKVILPYFLSLTFIFVFTVAYAYIKLTTMYGSWRQFTLMYPFIAIFSACGWNAFFNQIPKLQNKLIIPGILIIAFIHPIQFAIRNHPFEYVYYNEFIGGPRGAYGNYEWDYAFNSVRQGAEWLKTYIRKNHPPGTKLVIACNGGKEVAKYFEGFDSSITTVYTRYYERNTIDWDYAIFPNVYIHPFQLKNDVFPKKDSLHSIKVDGKPICFIYKRNNREDYEGSLAMKANDTQLAVQKFNSYLKYYPRSEWAWFQLSYINLQYNNFAQAQTFVTESFKHHPEFMPSKAAQGLIYLNTNRPLDAHLIFDKLIVAKYDLSNSYKWSALTYETQKNYKKAITQYGFALGAGNKEKSTYLSIANCLRQLGDNTQAAKYEALGR